MDGKIVCRALTGPTASGKTEISLSLAEKNGWEICCMDSMQIYRGMNIGTAKPTQEDRKRVRHYLLDLCDPGESFSVAMYREKAETLIREKWEKEGKELLFVGGTGLYLQAMMFPMGMGTAPADESMRRELHMLAEQPGGKETLHRMLRELDPHAARKLPPNDVRRVIRAIEVCRVTGIPFSEQPMREQSSEFEWRAAALEMPRETLYDRINRRVESMIEEGLEGEVRGLLESGVSPEAQSMQAIGYKEMILYIEGIWSLGKTIGEIQKATRHYAKRQETFLRGTLPVPKVQRFAPDAVNQIQQILEWGKYE